MLGFSLYRACQSSSVTLIKVIFSGYTFMKLLKHPLLFGAISCQSKHVLYVCIYCFNQCDLATAHLHRSLALPESFNLLSTKQVAIFAMPALPKMMPLCGCIIRSFMFHCLFTLAMGISHTLQFTYCNYSSNHPLENQCRFSNEYSNAKAIV